jgi:intron-binding protein aquarius
LARLLLLLCLRLCLPHLQAVLESIRDSLNEQLVIPEWLVDIFLGYGDAGAAHYTQMNGLLRTVDFKVGQWGQ